LKITGEIDRQQLIDDATDTNPVRFPGAGQVSMMWYISMRIMTKKTKGSSHSNTHSQQDRTTFRQHQIETRRSIFIGNQIANVRSKFPVGDRSSTFRWPHDFASFASCQTSESDDRRHPIVNPLPPDQVNTRAKSTLASNDLSLSLEAVIDEANTHHPIEISLSPLSPDPRSSQLLGLLLVHSAPPSLAAVIEIHLRHLPRDGQPIDKSDDFFCSEVSL
jgi:hypothetical protein